MSAGFVDLTIGFTENLFLGLEGTPICQLFFFRSISNLKWHVFSRLVGEGRFGCCAEDEGSETSLAPRQE